MIALDDVRRSTKRQRLNFAYSRRAEARYASQLRKVAKQCGDIVAGFDPEEPGFLSHVRLALTRYSEMIRPWARAVASRMIAEVALRDFKVWESISTEMGRGLREEIRGAATGDVLKAFLAENVHYITSIPRDAAERVHKMTMEGIAGSIRPKEVAKEIARTTGVSSSRATLIARTEIARTQSGLTMARALHVGSPGYTWRTARDSDVRQSHQEMEGKFVPWDEVPTLSDGTTTHAGMTFNCRCWAEVVIPDKFD